MASHKGWDRYFFTDKGSIITTGDGSSTLTKGEFGIFAPWTVISTGSTSVDSFSASTDYEFKVGKQGTNLSLRSNSDKAFSSFPFELANVVDVFARRPSQTVAYDSLLIGYDGSDSDTTLDFILGKSYELSIELSGESMALLGYDNGEVELKIHFTPPAGTDCVATVDCTGTSDAEALAMVTASIATFNDMTLMGGAPVTDYITATVVNGGGGLLAIRLVAKPVILAASGECLRDELPFIHTSTKISAAGGYPLLVGENFVTNGGRFNVLLESTRQEKEGLGGDLWDLEQRSKVFFDGEPRHKGQNYAKWALGEETVLDALVQYNDFAFTVRRVKNSQSFSGEGVETVTYHVVAPANSVTFTSDFGVAVQLQHTSIVADSVVIKTTDEVTTYNPVIYVVDEEFTSVHDSAVTLDETNILAASVVVKTTDGLITYVVTTDYTIDAALGKITVLSTGGMANTTAFDITYQTDEDYTVDYTAGTVTVISTGDMADATEFYINYTTDIEVLLDAFAEAASFDGVILP